MDGTNGTAAYVFFEMFEHNTPTTGTFLLVSNCNAVLYSTKWQTIIAMQIHSYVYLLHVIH